MKNVLYFILVVSKLCAIACALHNITNKQTHIDLSLIISNPRNRARWEKKIFYLILPHMYLAVKLNFRNILLFESENGVLGSAENTQDFQNL